MSYYKTYRPKTLKGVVGQEAALASLQSFVDKKKVPQAIMFTGPSGVGKTTIARILLPIVNCGAADYQEINAAEARGIDTVRDIVRRVNLMPIDGDARVFLIDECHMLTKEAQNALLKILEDMPAHVYFFLATTDPGKVIKTIHTRCNEVKLVALSMKELARTVQRVIDKESLEVSEDVIIEICEAADGSARKALVILEAVGGLEGDEAQIKAIQTTTFTKDQAFALARALFNPKVVWTDVTPILRNLKEEDPEGIRYCVLGYARSCMVGAEGKAPNPVMGKRAFMVIEIFGRNFYDSKQAGLAAACWEVCHPR